MPCKHTINKHVTWNLQQKKERSGTGSIDPRAPTKSHPTPGGGGGGHPPTLKFCQTHPPTPPPCGVGRTLSKSLYPAPPVLTGARFWFRVQKSGNTWSQCLNKPVLPRGTYHRTHVADISHPYPSKHDNTKKFSSCAQLRYRSVACILIDRHRIEALADLAPHREEPDILLFGAGLRAGVQAGRE